MKLWIYLLICLLAPGLCLTTGCGPSNPTAADFNNTNLKRLRSCYGIFSAAHRLKGPDNEAEFKVFLKTSPVAAKKMGLMNVSVDEVDSLFISERDSQPFKIRWGLVGMDDYPVIFEVEGLDGKRMVAYAVPRELNEAEYKAAWSGKAKAEASADVL